MARSLLRQQIIQYLLLMVFVSFLAMVAYPLSRPQYVLYRLGQTEWSRGDTTAALKKFEKALSFGNLSNKALLRIGELAFEANNTKIGDTALRALQQGVRVTTVEKDAAAGVYDAHGQPERAAAILESAGTALWENSAAVLHLADLQARLKQFEASFRLYKEILTRDPNNALVCIGYAQALFMAGDYTTAEEMTRHAIELTGKNRESRILLARVLTAMGRFDEAIDLYKAALGESL